MCEKVLMCLGVCFSTTNKNKVCIFIYIATNMYMYIHSNA